LVFAGAVDAVGAGAVDAEEAGGLAAARSVLDGEPPVDEADAEALTDASDVSLALRVQFACRS